MVVAQSGVELEPAGRGVTSARETCRVVDLEFTIVKPRADIAGAPSVADDVRPGVERDLRPDHEALLDARSDGIVYGAESFIQHVVAIA